MRYNVYATDANGKRFVLGVGLESHDAESLACEAVSHGWWAERGVFMQPCRPILPGDTAMVFRGIECMPEGEWELSPIRYEAGDSVMVLRVDGDRAKVTRGGLCPRWMPLDNLAR